MNNEHYVTVSVAVLMLLIPRMFPCVLVFTEGVVVLDIKYQHVGQQSGNDAFMLIRHSRELTN